MKHNYIDGKGNYHNELNYTLAQIYNSGVKFGCEVTAQGIIEELEKIKEEIQGIIDFEESCCGETTLGYQCLGVINNKLAELKGENK